MNEMPFFVVFVFVCLSNMLTATMTVHDVFQEQHTIEKPKKQTTAQLVLESSSSIGSGCSCIPISLLLVLSLLALSLLAPDAISVQCHTPITSLFQSLTSSATK